MQCSVLNVSVLGWSNEKAIVDWLLQLLKVIFQIRKREKYEICFSLQPKNPIVLSGRHQMLKYGMNIFVNRNNVLLWNPIENTMNKKEIIRFLYIWKPQTKCIFQNVTFNIEILYVKSYPNLPNKWQKKNLMCMILTVPDRLCPKWKPLSRFFQYLTQINISGA